MWSVNHGVLLDDPGERGCSPRFVECKPTELMPRLNIMMDWKARKAALLTGTQERESQLGKWTACTLLTPDFFDKQVFFVSLLHQLDINSLWPLDLQRFKEINFYANTQRHISTALQPRLRTRRSDLQARYIGALVLQEGNEFRCLILMLWHRRAPFPRQWQLCWTLTTTYEMFFFAW